MSDTTTSKKVIIVGDGGVGKSALINKFKTEKFIKQYIPTMGAEVHPINVGNHCIKFWDTAGQEKFSGLRQGYYIESDMAIVMYDNTSRLSHKNVNYWIRSVQRVCPNIPILVVRNKVDLPGKKDNICGIENGPISVRTGENIDRLLTIIDTILYPMHSKW